MMDFTSRYPALITLLFLLISIAVSYYFYRRTELPPLKKYLLIALKSAAIFIILSLFIEPAISAFISPRSDFKNLILIDDSRSNLLKDENGKTKIELIKNFADKNFIGNDGYALFTFGSPGNNPENISTVDSIRSDAAQTNLSESLSKLLSYYPERNFNSVTIISDGVFNSGGNPLYQARLFGVPFITVGVGDTLQKKDAVLGSIYFEDKAFTGTNNQVKVFVDSYELQNENLNINLTREGTVIQTKSIHVSLGKQTDEVDFETTEQNPGIVKYSVEIAPQNGEVNYQNNRQQFLIEYIDNKNNILLISSGPGYDNSAITDILKRIRNYNITTRTVKSQNEFYEGAIDYKTFGELSAVVLLGFPIAQFSNELTSNIASKIKEYKIPLIFFAQKNTDYKKLEMFDENIPFTANSQNSGEKEFNPQVVVSQENGFSETGQDINSAPQIFCNVSGIIPKAGAVTLMTNKTSGEPIFVLRKTGAVNSSAFLGYGLWRWELNPQAAHKKTLENFLAQSVNQTLLREKKTRFRLYPEKNVFDYTENIVLRAEVFDEDYKPSRNAAVTAKISLNGNKVKDVSLSQHDSKYSASIGTLPFGDYAIEGTAEMNGNYYAGDKSRFLVDSLNTEYLNTSSDFESLREISEKTGGEFFRINDSYRDITRRINSISNSGIDRTEMKKKENFNLWENKYVLLLIILLFSAEWVIRKRNNIP